LSLFLVTIVSRVPFTSKLLYSADSTQFALALKDYDVTIHQPHPPGYFLYVMLGRLFNLFISDANTVFVVISIIFSGFSVVVIYCLCKEMFEEKTALIAAALAITSPNLWFHGEVALSYVLEVFFSSLIALLCWRIYKRGHSYIWLLAIVLAVAGGVRQNTPVFLAPVVLFSVMRVPVTRIVAAAFLFGVVSLAWFLPMLNMTGGFDAYSSAIHELWQFTESIRSVFNVGGPTFKFFAETLLCFVIFNIGGGFVVLVCCIYYMIRNNRLRNLICGKTLFFVLWILPSFLFHLLIFIHPSVPGYVLIFAPPLFILTAQSIIFLSCEIICHTNRDLSKLFVVVLILINLHIFFISHFMISFHEIIKHDNKLASIIEALKDENPDTTVLFFSHNNIFYNFKHIIYYLPTYTVFDPYNLFTFTGEIRQKICRVDGKTFLTSDITLPRKFCNFATLLTHDEVESIRSVEGITIKEPMSTVYVAVGRISFANKIFHSLKISSEINSVILR
jgi:hypothetical protein